MLFLCRSQNIRFCSIVPGFPGNLTQILCCDLNPSNQTTWKLTSSNQVIQQVKQHPTKSRKYCELWAKWEKDSIEKHYLKTKNLFLAALNSYKLKVLQSFTSHNFNPIQDGVCVWVGEVKVRRPLPVFHV